MKTVLKGFGLIVGAYLFGHSQLLGTASTKKTILSTCRGKLSKRLPDWLAPSRNFSCTLKQLPISHHCLLFSVWSKSKLLSIGDRSHLI